MQFQDLSGYVTKVQQENREQVESNEEHRFSMASVTSRISSTDLTNLQTTKKS